MFFNDLEAKIIENFGTNFNVDKYFSPEYKHCFLITIRLPITDKQYSVKIDYDKFIKAETKSNEELIKEIINGLHEEIKKDQVNSIEIFAYKGPLNFTYKNWKGEVGDHKAIPIRTYYGSTNYHTEPQWLLEAYDIEKREIRHFALKDITPITDSVAK